MPPESTEDRIRDVGVSVYSLVLRAVAAFVVLVVFAGLAFLVYVGRVDSGALLLYAGVIIGYIIHASKQAM